jgi:hypothetical protein
MVQAPHRRIAADGQSAPFGRHPRPDFEPKVSGSGEPTGTAVDDHERRWRGRCCHKRRLENRLMVRRRDP